MLFILLFSFFCLFICLLVCLFICLFIICLLFVCFELFVWLFSVCVYYRIVPFLAFGILVCQLNAPGVQHNCSRHTHCSGRRSAFCAAFCDSRLAGGLAGGRAVDVNWFLAARSGGSATLRLFYCFSVVHVM